MPQSHHRITAVEAYALRLERVKGERYMGLLLLLLVIFLLFGGGGYYGYRSGYYGGAHFGGT